jgi:hypothetical protein
MNELTTLIQQALDNGDTAIARALSRALENQTKISTIPVQQEEYYPQQQYLPPQQVYTQQPQYLDVYHEPVEYYEPIAIQSQRSVSISALVCLVILPYLAIAEVLAPGHQGPLKVHQMNLDWPVEMVGGIFPKGGSTDAQSE